MADRLRVLVCDFLGETSVEQPVLGDIADITLARAWHEDELRPHLADADVMILFHDIASVTEASLARAAKCRGVVRAGVGFNNVDWKAAAGRGMLVCNVPDYGTEEVADHAIMLMLAVARRLLICDKAIRAGEWDWQTAVPTPRLRGKTFGVVGCGRIGTATALRAKAFGMDVVFYDPYLPPGVDKALGIRRVPSMRELCARSHVVSLHCYLDERSRHIVDREALAAMRPGSILVNTARGPCVEQEALVEALESGKLHGAGIDVFEREPLDDDRLRNHPNVILTPHSAFYSVEGFEELRRKTAEEARRLLLGEVPLNCVNRAFIKDPRTRIA